MVERNASEGGPVAEIVAWLRGLERRLGTVTELERDPVLLARRGLYDGVADDIVSKWGKFMSQVAAQARTTAADTDAKPLIDWTVLTPMAAWDALRAAPKVAGPKQADGYGRPSRRTVDRLVLVESKEDGRIWGDPDDAPHTGAQRSFPDWPTADAAFRAAGWVLVDDIAPTDAESEAIAAWLLPLQVVALQYDNERLRQLVEAVGKATAPQHVPATVTRLIEVWAHEHELREIAEQNSGQFARLADELQETIDRVVESIRGVKPKGATRANVLSAVGDLIAGRAGLKGLVGPARIAVDRLQAAVKEATGGKDLNQAVSEALEAARELERVAERGPLDRLIDAVAGWASKA